MKTPTENQDIIRPPPTETQMDQAVIPRKESTITCQLNPIRGGFNKIHLYVATELRFVTMGAVMPLYINLTVGLVIWRKPTGFNKTSNTHCWVNNM